VWSLRKSLLLSIVLGLVLVLISFIGSREVQWDDLVWAVVVCVALTLGKTLSKRSQFTVAVLGLLGALLAKFINDQTLLNYDVVDVVRIILYPVLGWTITKLERYELAHMTRAVRTWLFPLLVIPAVAVAVIAITQNPVSRVIAEVVFAVGCGLIVHMHPVPGDQSLARAE
jgi:hypothetical protein